MENPMLWWPNGYGNQNLYSVKVVIKYEKTVIDFKEFKIGFRTLTLSNKKDKWGNEFCSVINGEKILSIKRKSKKLLEVMNYFFSLIINYIFPIRYL